MHLRTALIAAAALLAVLGGSVAAQADSSLSAPVSNALNKSDPLSASDDFSVGTPTSNVIPDAAQAAPSGRRTCRGAEEIADARRRRGSCEGSGSG